MSTPPSTPPSTPEQSFRHFVQNVREYALVQTDIHGLVTAWNPGAQQLFGFSADQILHQPFSLLLPPEDRASGIVQQEIGRVAHGERASSAHTLQRQDGSRFWAEWITEPLRDENGVICGTAKIIRDETERQRADEQLRTSLAEKEALLREVHHRVKNNLQVITSLLNLHARTLSDPGLLSALYDTRNRVEAIAAIHESLYHTGNFAAVDLLAYAERLVSDLLRLSSAQDRIQTSVTGEHLSLSLDRAIPFGLLLNELVSNALRHGLPAPGSGSLHISLLPEDGTLHLRVQDTGAGLPTGFDPAAGHSLGLKLVRILVSQLGGELRFQSEVGTSVHVRIPVSAEARPHDIS